MINWYVGVKYGRSFTRCDIFKSDSTPTQATHGHKYAFCFGGYRAQWQAIRVAMYHNYGIDTPKPRNRISLAHLDDPHPNELYKIFSTSELR